MSNSNEMVRTCLIPQSTTIEVFGTDEYELRVIYTDTMSEEWIYKFMNKHEVCEELTNLNENVLCIKVNKVYDIGFNKDNVDDWCEKKKIPYSPLYKLYYSMNYTDRK